MFGISQLRPFQHCDHPVCLTLVDLPCLLETSSSCDCMHQLKLNQTVNDQEHQARLTADELGSTDES